MPSYMTTPLFSIQEAVNSATSLPQAPPILPDVSYPTKMSNSDEGNKLATLVENYRKSEREYLMELQILESIVKSFDPVYDNYFDSSLEDITNEMVKLRKEKNLKLHSLVRKMLQKHQQLDRFLNMSDYHTMLVRISEWGIDVNRLYLEYLQHYKLDINQPKTEVKTRRRPLIRIRYLNNFVKSLKSIVIQMGEKPYSAELLSNIEVIIFKLSECLKEARALDETERQKWENYVHTSSAKDIIQLRSVCVGVGQDLFESPSYTCDLHYKNKSQKASLDFTKIEIKFLDQTGAKSIAIIQKDFSGKNLLFAPIKQNELKHVKTTGSLNCKSLFFNHSTMNDTIEFCFRFDCNTEVKLDDKLIDMFPQRLTKTILKPSTLGLGISFSEEAQKGQEPIVIHQDFKKIANTREAFVSAPAIQPEFEEIDLENESPIKDNKDDLVIPPRKSTSIPLSKLKLSLNMNDAAVSRYLNTLVSSDNIDEAPTSIVNDKSKQDQLSREMLHKIVEGESSDDESVLSATEGLNFLPLDKLPTPPKEEPAVNVSVDERAKDMSSLSIATSASASTSETKRSINVEKYQHSLQPFTNNERKKPRHQSIFGSLSSFLTKKSSKKSAIVPQHMENNLAKPQHVSPTKSLHSITSAVSDKSADTELNKIIFDANCISRQLPNAKVSLWSRNTWTKVKDVKLVVHSVNDDKDFYLGVYERLSKSTSDSTISSISISSSSKDKYKLPILLLKLSQDTDCMFNTIDIHVKTNNHRNELLTVLIRPLDSFGMKLIGNALVCPEAIDIIMNSSSCDSELSKRSVATQGTSLSSIESEAIEEVPVKEDLTKSWSGMGSIKLIEESGKLKDLNRCVFSIDKKHGDQILIDMTGFEFGNIELKVEKEQIKDVGDLQVMVKGERSYVLTFDCNEDVEMFYECVC